jgi:hypothetical protein
MLALTALLHLLLKGPLLLLRVPLLMAVAEHIRSKIAIKAQRTSR